MKIAYQQLEQHLKKLAPIYLVSGDEILLVQEACDSIRAAARHAGFSERVVITVEPKMDWVKVLHEEMKSISLFTSKRFLEIHLGNSKPNAALTKALQSLIQDLSSENILLFRLPKIDSKTEKTVWFKTLDKIGVHVQIWPINHDQLPAWIMQRAKKMQMEINADAAKFLALQVEGNLLAAAQELEKIVLLKHQGKIDLTTIENAVIDNARYDIFTLVENALAGNANKSLRILENLRAEGTEPVLILWALMRELRVMAELSRQVSLGQTLSSLFGKYRIWEKRQAGVRRFLQQHNQLQCWHLIKKGAQIDKQIKGASAGNIWDSFQQLTLQMTGNAIISYD